MNKKIIMNRSTLRKLVENPVVQGVILNKEYIVNILNKTSDKNHYKNMSYILEISTEKRTYKMYYTDSKLKHNFKL